MLFFTCNVSAANTQVIADALLSRIENGIGVGSVLGIIDGDQEEIIAVGFGDIATQKPLTKASLINLGSVSKAFTGILLADMILKKEIDLDAPVENYFPKHVIIPSYNGQKITIRHLATHRSAMPSDPGNLRSSDSYNLWNNYSTDEFYHFLATYKLERPPGEKPEYSNTGVALLGHTLEVITGKSFETLLKERVLIPLGMHQTTITMSKDQQAINTSGHNQLKEAVYNGKLTTFAPSGGIRSTGQDMMRFLKANMGLIETPITDAIELSHQALSITESPDYSYGLFWGVWDQDDELFVHHLGAVSGYRAYIGFYKSKKTGYFLINNSFDNAWDLVWAIDANNIESLVQNSVNIVLVPKTLLEQYTGTYVFDDDEQLIVTQSNGELFVQTPGKLKIRTLATSMDKFVFTFVEGTMRFVTDKDGRVTHLQLTQNGDKTAVKLTGS